MVCSRCQRAKYCSKECQVLDWKAHKGACAVVRAYVEEQRTVVNTREKCALCRAFLPAGEVKHAYFACCGGVICAPCIEDRGNDGMCLLCAATMPTDDAGYLALLEHRCAREDPEAQHRLGMKYHRGGECGLRRDDRRAVELYKAAAGHGFTKAMCELGSMFTLGEGALRRDDRRAARWFEQAAKLGDSLGQHHYASMLYQGQGVNKDVSEAVRFWRLAAAQGEPKAQAFLGACFFRGEGVPRDLHESLRLVKLAAAAGVAGAQKHARRIEAILARSK